MKNLSKQVVILDSISSPYIHQAIIILKSYPPGQHDKIIAEAEKIVSSYFDRRHTDINNKSDTKILRAAVIFLSIALFVSSYFAFIK